MLSGIRSALERGESRIETRDGNGGAIAFDLDLGERHREVLLAGGLINRERGGSDS